MTVSFALASNSVTVLQYKKNGGEDLRRLGEEPKGESPMLHFRIAEETMARLKALAKKEGVSVSAFARSCLERSIGKDKKA